MDARPAAEAIIKKLNQAGYTAYFAGGWVRDFLMGHPSDDIDIATDAPPEKILHFFPKANLVGLAFGVVIISADGHQFEVATFRKDLEYKDGRKPSQIELSTAEEDALRRDFTINGMFYDPLEHIVHDFVQGAEDIKKGIVRAIGNADERFAEDRLRMLRAIRFASRFGFSIDPETQEGILGNADTLFPAVAMERVWQELTKMSKSPRFDRALIEMHRLNLLQAIFPELRGTHLHTIEDAVSGFKNFPPQTETILYLLELFPLLTKAKAQELCQYLRASNGDSQLAEFLVSMRKHIESEHELSVIDPIAWTHLYAHPAAKKCLHIVASKLSSEKRKYFTSKHDDRMNSLKSHIDRIVRKKPLINASILQKEGIHPGKLMGILIKEAERLAILNNLNDAEAALVLLKTVHAWPKEK